MLKLISPRRAEKILKTQGEWIKTVAARYGVPAAVIRAILYQEMIEIDLMDMLADLAVWSNLTAKKDSSTGYAQIFGRVGLNAVNFAVDRGLTDYTALGIGSDHRLEGTSREDVRLVWKLLHRDVRANIEIAALNLLCAAEEMTGRIDFAGFNEQELKLVLTRYNANVRTVTPYGERAYAHYLRYSGQNI